MKLESSSKSWTNQSNNNIGGLTKRKINQGNNFI